MAVKQDIPYLWVFAITAVLSYGIVSFILPHPADNKENSGIIASGKTMPDAYFFDAKGQKKTLADFKDDVVLVNLWATWCLPCVAEMPSLDGLQAKFKGKKFEVVAISMDRQTAKTGAVPKMISGFMAKKKIRHLHPYWDKERQLTEKWTYEGLPTSFLLDKSGVVTEIFKGPVDWSKPDIAEKVQKLF